MDNRTQNSQDSQVVPSVPNVIAKYSNFQLPTRFQIQIPKLPKPHGRKVKDNFMWPIRLNQEIDEGRRQYIWCSSLATQTLPRIGRIFEELLHSLLHSRWSTVFETQVVSVEQVGQLTIFEIKKQWQIPKTKDLHNGITEASQRWQWRVYIIHGMLNESRLHNGRVDKLRESQVKAKVTQRSCRWPTKRPLHNRVKAFRRPLDASDLNLNAPQATTSHHKPPQGTQRTTMTHGHNSQSTTMTSWGHAQWQFRNRTAKPSLWQCLAKKKTHNRGGEGWGGMLDPRCCFAMS